MKYSVQYHSKIRAMLVFAMFVALVYALIFGAVSYVEAQPIDEVRRSLSSPGGGATGAESTVETILQEGLNIFSLIIGVFGVFFVSVGAFKYVTSGGDASKAQSARNTILYALAGLVLAALAQVIVRYVLARVPN